MNSIGQSVLASFTCGATRRRPGALGPFPRVLTYRRPGHVNIFLIYIYASTVRIILFFRIGIDVGSHMGIDIMGIDVAIDIGIDIGIRIIVSSSIVLHFVALYYSAHCILFIVYSIYIYIVYFIFNNVQCLMYR